jgi:uncharacterized repeat protein (TIGR01451 family)
MELQVRQSAIQATTVAFASGSSRPCAYAICKLQRILLRVATAAAGWMLMGSVMAQRADLAIVQTPLQQTAAIGGPVGFEIVISNHGPDTVDGAALSLPVAMGFTAQHLSCVSTDVQQRCPKALDIAALQDGSLVIPALASGQVVRLIIQGIADGNASAIVQTATVKSPPGFTDSDTGNNLAEARIVVGEIPRTRRSYVAGTAEDQPSAVGADVGGRDSPGFPRLPQVDLAVEKAGPAVAAENGPLEFSIVVSNDGPEDADGAILQDARVANFTGSTVSCGNASGGAVCPSAPTVSDLQTSGVIIPVLPSGGSLTFTLRGNVGSNTANVNNSATIRPPDGLEEINEANNEDTATVLIPVIRLTKIATSLLPDSAVPGQFIARFTVVVVNQGNGPTTYGELIDTPELPPQLEIVRTAWDINGGTGGNVQGPGPYELAPAGTAIGGGGSDTYDLRVYFRNNDPAQPIPPCSLTNTASLPSGQEADTGDNSACLPEDSPTVSIADAATVPEGGTLNYAITLSGASVADTVVNISLGGSATGDSDYTTPSPLSATIPAGSTTASLSVATLTDTVFEGDETVTVTLQPGDGYSVGAPAVGSGIITDAQTAPTASIADATTVTEGGTLSYAVALSGTTTIDTVVNFSIDGTATAGSDYITPNPLSVVIPAGATNAPIPIITLTDALFEGDETVAVTLQPGSGYDVGAPATGSGTITDAQAAPTASIGDAATVTEGGTLSYPITLDVASTVDTVVNVGLGGTATSGTDYTPPSPLSLTIPAGATTASLSVATLTDTVFEGDETVVVSLLAGSGYGIGTPATGSGTIADAQGEPVASIADAVAVTEGGTLNYAVSLDVASTTATVITISLGGTATSAADYTPPNPLSVTIPAGATTAMLPITTLTDALSEGDETVTVSLQQGAGYNVGVPASGTGTITDGQGEPVASIAHAATVTEGGTLSYVVTLDVASTADTVVNVSLGGTATSGIDYSVPSPLSVTVSAGATTAALSITTLVDSVYEGDETVLASLQPGTGYTVGTPGNGIGTIADGQGQPVASIADAAAVTEGGTLNYAITLSSASAASTVITVSLGGTATSGTDYTPPNPLSVTIPTGATSTALPISTLADTVYEGDETIVVSLQSGAGYTVGTPGAGSGTINDGQQQVVAEDDSGSIGGTAGGTAVANVLANDMLGGAPAAAPQVSLEPLPSSSRFLTLDVGSGEVRVPETTPRGTYILHYRLCETASPENCDEATVTVTVTQALIEASNDIQGELVIGSHPVQAPINVFSNDTLDGQPLDFSRVALTTVTVGPVMIQPDGVVVVQAETPAGAYEVAYQICELLNTDNCDDAIVVIRVLSATIDAVDDGANVPQNTAAVVVVMANDQFDGQPVEPTAATVSILSAPANGVAAVDGEKRVVYTPTTNFSGTDTFRYELCEAINPDNCTAAVVTVTVAINQITAIDDSANTDAATAVTIAVLANDTTLSAPLDPASLEIVSPPDRGSASCASGVCEYLPSAGRAAAGDDRFIYQVCDVSIPVPVCETAVVTIAIAAGDAVLRVSKQAVPRQAKPGDLVRYTLTVQNVGEVAATDVTLVDLPPAGFSYVDGSLSVDDSDNTGRVDGMAPLRIGGIDVAIGANATITYFLRVGAGVGPGTHRNTVIATGSDGAPISNEGSAEVEITGDPLFEDSLIIGTVFDDHDGDGWQDPPDESGMPGVRLVSVEGLVIETDAYGRFHIAGVPGGNPTRGYNFILKVDRATLPPGTEFTTENPRVKRITPGLPARFDFGIRLPAASGSSP